MDHTPVRNAVKGPEAAFTGDVYVTPLKAATEPSRLISALVRFTPGARTHWHSHALGQTLHVTEGVGLVVTRDGDVARVRAGDTVWCPPGEEHWHGGTEGTVLCHIAMVETPGDGDGTTWLEPVTDDQYTAAHQQ
ncbi:cupin domain-containing protein [Streptomyces sp. NPDC052535]|uniref:(R)-mandelonitrile lyase n=1 Tax=Streptomyces sp. NPDC052535 TaxID=3155531 RepID=UPI003418C4C8